MRSCRGCWTRCSPQMRDPVLVRHPVLPAAAGAGVDRGAQAGAPRSLPTRDPGRVLPPPRRLGQPVDGPGLGRSPPPAGNCWRSWAMRAIYAYLAPWHLPADQWYTWVIALVGVDLLFYAYHRIAHRVRLIWATHQAHHSSQYFNFATALRQKWNNSGEILMWIPLPLLGCSAVDGVRELLGQPDLPVLGAHRAHRKALAASRIRVQHAVASPGAPRHGPAVPGQELRRASSSCGTGSSAPIRTSCSGRTTD